MKATDKPEKILQLKNAVIDSEITAEYVRIGDDYYTNTKQLVFSCNSCEKPTPYVNRTILNKSTISAGDNWSETIIADVVLEIERCTKFILLGDAGFGKSIELQKIGYDLQLKGYEVSYLKLKELVYENQFNSFRLNPIDIKEIKKRILLLDGLDEVKIHQASKAINTLQQEYPKLKIIVSCRTNIYNNSLDNFKCYYLQKFNERELHNYLDQYLQGKKNQFLKAIPTNEIQELILIPFFLDKAANFYKDNKENLPDNKIDLLEYFIEESFKVRLKDNSTIPVNKKKRKKSREALEKLAFVMECLASNSINIDSFKKVIGKKKNMELLLKKNSLIHFNSTNFIFAHRIVQEYLAAIVLSKLNSFKKVKKCIAFRPDFKRPKLSWLNTISDLFSIIETNSKIYKKLLKWIQEESPEKVIKFEKSKFDSSFRDNILIQIFEAYKKENLVFPHYEVKPWDLASFSESYNTFEYLVRELELTSNYKIKTNALSLLNNFLSYYLIDDKKDFFRRLLKQNIRDLKINKPYVRHLSLEVLLRFYDDLSNQEVDEIFNLFYDSSNSHERLSVYKLIHITNFQQEYMKPLLYRLNQLDDSNWRGDEHLADEDWYLEKCLKDLKSKEALLEFFKIYPQVFPNRYTNLIRDSFFYLLQKTKDFHLNEEDYLQIYSHCTEKFYDKLLNSNSIEQNELIIRIIDKCSRRLDFFDFAFKHEWYSYRILAILVNDKIIKDLIDKFQTKVIDIKWVENFQYVLRNYNDKFLKKFNKEFNTSFNTSIPLPKLVERINPDEERQQIAQYEKSLFFNQSAYIKVANKIFSNINDRKDINKEDFSNFQKNQISKGLSYKEFPFLIEEFILNRCPNTKDEIIRLLKENWDWTVVWDLRRLMSRNKELKLLPSEKKWLIKWCTNYLEKIDITKSPTYGDIIFTHYTILLKQINYPKELYLYMIGNGIQNHIGSELDILSFLLNSVKIAEDEINEKILSCLKNKSTKGYELLNFFHYLAKRPNYKAAKHLQYYIETSDSRDYRTKAFYAYSNCLGNKSRVFDLLIKLPFCDEIEYEVIQFCKTENKEETEKILLKKYCSTSEPKQKITYARWLVKLNNIEGIKYLYEYTKKEKVSPFSSAFSRTNIKFSNKYGIKYLLKLLDVNFSEDLKDDYFESCFHAVRGMISNLALNDNGQNFKFIDKRINQYIQNNINTAHPKTIEQLKYLRKEMANSYYHKQEISLKDALSLYKKNHEH